MEPHSVFSAVILKMKLFRGLAQSSNGASMLFGRQTWPGGLIHISK